MSEAEKKPEPEARHHLTPPEIDQVGEALVAAGAAGMLTLVNARHAETRELHTLLGFWGPASPDRQDSSLIVCGRLFGPADLPSYDPPTQADNTYPGE